MAPGQPSPYCRPRVSTSRVAFPTSRRRTTAGSCSVSPRLCLCQTSLFSTPKPLLAVRLVHLDCRAYLLLPVGGYPAPGLLPQTVAGAVYTDSGEIRSSRIESCHATNVCYYSLCLPALLCDCLPLMTILTAIDTFFCCCCCRRSQFGGGVYALLLSGHIDVVATEIVDCTAQMSGGGIFVDHS